MTRYSLKRWGILIFAGYMALALMACTNSDEKDTKTTTKATKKVTAEETTSANEEVTTTTEVATLETQAAETTAAQVETEENDDLSTTALYPGTYTDADDNSVTISDNGDGTFAVNLSIFRLASIDGVGTENADGLVVEGVDPSENPITILFSTDGTTATAEVIDSTWEYLANGSSFNFTKN